MRHTFAPINLQVHGKAIFDEYSFQTMHRSLLYEFNIKNVIAMLLLYRYIIANNPRIFLFD